MTTRYKARLDRLEQRAPALWRQHDEGYQEWMAWFTAIAAGMAPEHRALIEPDFPLVICPDHCWPAADYRPPHPLATELHHLMLDALERTPPRAVALPPAVGAVYVARASAAGTAGWPQALDVCQACGLRLPMLMWHECWQGGTPLRHILQRARHFFAQCPACGGPVAFEPSVEHQRRSYEKMVAQYGRAHEP